MQSVRQIRTLRDSQACLVFLFFCRVRTERKGCRERERKRRTRRPKRKCATAATGIAWCQAPSPAPPPAHCAAKACRKSMACSACVSNATDVHALTLVHSLTHMCTGAAISHTHTTHAHLHHLLHAHSLTCRSTRACSYKQPSTHAHTPHQKRVKNTPSSHNIMTS